MSSAPSAMQEVSPHLAEITDRVLWGDLWEHPALSKRDRSLVLVGVLTALYRTEQLRGHIGRALDNGVTKDELGEIFLHMAFYGGWPVAVNALRVAKDVFDGK